MTSRRRRVLGSILALALGVLVLLAWPGSPDAPPDESVERDAPAVREAPTLQGHPADAAPEDPAGREANEAPPWSFSGEVVSVDPEITTARVEARWWPVRPLDPDAQPAAVFRTPDLDVAGTAASFRLEGSNEGGYVRLFLLAGGRVDPFDPFAADPGYDVQPRRGLGIGLGRVGTFTLRGHAVDKQGRPVGGIKLTVRGPSPREGRHVTTGEDGRFLVGGFSARGVRVTYVERSTYNHFAEFAGFRDREVTLSEEETRLVIPRNPRVVIRGRVEGFDPRATCSPSFVQRTLFLPGGKEQPRGWSWWPQHGFHVQPGRWRLDATFVGAPEILVSAAALALDEVKTFEVDVGFTETVGVVEIGFDAGPRFVDDPVACAVEGRVARGTKGWAGTRTVAQAATVLLVLPPDTYDVVGAIRMSDEVRISAPTRVEIRGGDRERLTLRTERAGGILVPAVPRHLDGVQFLELVERDFPGHGCVQGEPFEMAWLGQRQRATTWWVPPGRYTLRRRDQGHREISRLEVEVRAGQVTALEEGPLGLVLRED